MHPVFITFFRNEESGYPRLSRRQLLIKNFQLHRGPHRVSGPLTHAARAHTSTRRVPYVCVRVGGRRRNMHSCTHAYIHTSRPRTIYAEFDSGTSHIRTRVNQRIGTLDSSTHITSQSARRHLKISFGRVSAAASRHIATAAAEEPIRFMSRETDRRIFAYPTFVIPIHISSLVRATNQLRAAARTIFRKETAALDIPSE